MAATNDLSEKLLGNENEIEDTDPLVTLEEQTIVFETTTTPSSDPPPLAAVSVQAGEKQPDRLRDAWAAVLFLIQFIAIHYLAIAWGWPSLTIDSTDDGSHRALDEADSSTVSLKGILLLCLLTSTAALGLSAFGLALLVHYATLLVQISLLVTVAANAVFVIYFALQFYWLGAGFTLFFCLVSLWYAARVWRRIPAAAATLKTAVEALEPGLFLLSLVQTAAVFFYCLVWMLAMLGVYARTAEIVCHDIAPAGDDENADTVASCTTTSNMNPATAVGLLLSFYWTVTVGQNLLHVTVAGVVGTFWFTPSDGGSKSCWSPVVSDSFFRASTYSFGSICLGSLVTAVLQVLHHLARSARRHGRGSSLVVCVLQCISGCLERLVAYFNKWAYVYIGLYGYDYLTAGKAVVELFTQRGWTMIIQDDLIRRALVMLSWVIGLTAGAIGYALGKMHPAWLQAFHSDSGDDTGVILLSFGLPLMIGVSMAVLCLSVVSSACDTVLVALAEAPGELERNHPGLYRSLTTAFATVYPREFRI